MGYAAALKIEVTIVALQKHFLFDLACDVPNLHCKINSATDIIV